MSNPRGYHSHGTRGGRYARKRMLSVDFSGFRDYAEKLDNVGANIQDIFGKVMEEAAEKVQDDVRDAMAEGNLPAKGKYSKGATKQSIIDDVSVRWSGTVGEIGIGFDKSKPGVGTWLITGTPKMQPVKELAAIFGSKKYERTLKQVIDQKLAQELERRMSNA